MCLNRKNYEWLLQFTVKISILKYVKVNKNIWEKNMNIKDKERVMLNKELNVSVRGKFPLTQ